MLPLRINWTLEDAGLESTHISVDSSMRQVIALVISVFLCSLSVAVLTLLHDFLFRLGSPPGTPSCLLAILELLNCKEGFVSFYALLF